MGGGTEGLDSELDQFWHPCLLWWTAAVAELVVGREMVE